MKSKLSMKILGIVVAFATLASLLVGITAAPASAAAGTLDYGLISTPSAVGHVLVGGVHIDFMAASPDGTTIFAYDNEAGKMYKSTDGGVTFGNGKAVGTAGDAVGLAVSPKYATDGAVVLADYNAVYLSVNGGAYDASAVDNLQGSQLGLGYITSVDLGYYYKDNTLSVIIGLTGEIDASSYVLKFTYGTSVWKPLGDFTGLDSDVVGVKFSPNHLNDAEIVAVYKDGEGGIYLSSLFGTYDWNATAYPDTPIRTGADSDLGVYAAVIAFPSNYTTSAGFVVGLQDDNGTGNLYYVSGRGGHTSPKGSAKLKYSDDAGQTADIWSIAVSASCATVWFGNTENAAVQRSTNISASSATWADATKDPTGADSANVIAAGTKVYAGVSGNGGALSVSIDGGVTFNQTALINVHDLSTCWLNDLKVVDANTMFLTMGNTSGRGWYYIFRTTDGGATWQRITTEQVNMSLDWPNNDFLLSVSPAYATDKTLVYAINGDPMCLQSTDGGQTFSASPVPGVSAITALQAGAAGAIYAGGAGSFFKSGRWSGSTADITGNVFSIAIKDTAETTIAVGTDGGKVYQSTDNGATFKELKTAVATSLDAGGDNWISVTYGPDGTLYATGNDGLGIWRYTGTDWKSGGASVTEGTNTVTPGECYAITVAKDGTLYTSDADDGGGIWRSLAPTTATPEYQPIDYFNFPSVKNCNPADGNTSTGNLIALQVVNAATMNTLYAINYSYSDPNAATPYGYAGRIMAFQDTFITAPTLSSPANGAVLSSTTSADLAWNAFTGAKYYQPVVNTKSDFSGTDKSPVATTNAYATAGSLGVGSTYYWKVRASSTTSGNALYSRYSTSQSFITALPAPTDTTPMFPKQGATNVPVDTTFTWPVPDGTPAGSTYEFVIAEELGNVDKFAIIDYSATCPTNATALRETLKYDTIYWWRVRTVTGTSKSAWTVSFFTTAKEPVTTTATSATVPPVTITNTSVVITQTQTTLTVTNPTPTQAPPAIPSYLLWAVIAVGAILVIAVIVLIVRTRKI